MIRPRGEGGAAGGAQSRRRRGRGAASATYVLPLGSLETKDRARVGGKAVALAAMARAGIAVPDGLVVTTDAYHDYVGSAGLRERILMELNRKEFSEMRWEEMWDAALRIRSLFLTTPLPVTLRDALGRTVGQRFRGKAVVVRSSAPGEDSATSSFAGLHESYVNVRGTTAILQHVRLVWASLWSDGALLYRQELGLDPARSAMAVVVQEIVAGQRSGVAFSRSPQVAAQSVVEAVHGLNQGLVDGTVAPDRWLLDREHGTIVAHHPAERHEMMAPSRTGVRLVAVPARKRGRPPLAEDEVRRVWELSRRAETFFARPQDVEWTMRGSALLALQSRPITTGGELGEADGRGAYLSLRRSFDNLKRLRARIEGELIPAMIAQGEELGTTELQELGDAELLAEVSRRRAIRTRWVDVYTTDFIPFAHGARVFGQVYNDALRPDDPFEFLAVLGDTPMVSLRRNRALADLAAMVRADAALAAASQAGPGSAAGSRPAPGSLADRGDDAFAGAVSSFLEEFGETTWAGARLADRRDALVHLAVELASRGVADLADAGPSAEALRARFLDAFSADDRAFAEEILDLGRASYRLRDDDNLYLGVIEGQLVEAEDEAVRRGLLAQDGPVSAAAPALPAAAASGSAKTSPGTLVRARQMVGQPAGPGVATGAARVVISQEDLFAMQAGEVLVCDAIDPNMTFVVPLAAGIVERRGGMLIHGAIIAREYGLPCVTGVPEATTQIRTGDRVTVDGYLGIVIVA